MGFVLWFFRSFIHLDSFIHNTNSLNFANFLLPQVFFLFLFFFITQPKFLCSLNWYQNWEEANWRMKKSSGGFQLITIIKMFAKYVYLQTYISRKWLGISPPIKTRPAPMIVKMCVTLISWWLPSDLYLFFA